MEAENNYSCMDTQNNVGHKLTMADSLQLKKDGIVSFIFGLFILVSYVCNKNVHGL